MRFFNKYISLSLAALLAAILLVPSCKDGGNYVPQISKPASEYAAEVPLKWNQLFQDVDRFSPGYRPPAAARLLAYTGLAAYEAAVPGMPEYNSLANHYQGLSIPATDENSQYHWPAAVNAAYHQMFLYFYPHISSGDKAKIEALNQGFEAQFTTEAGAEVFARSKAYGEAVALAVFNWSKTDASGHESFLDPRPASYTPPSTGANGEHLWQPTTPDFTKALFPYWGNVRTFAMTPGDKIAKPPIAWSEDPNSQFYNQAKEIKLWVDNATNEDVWVAEFWSDDIFELTFEPAARLIAIANQLVAEEKTPLDRSLELYAKMGMALCDVGVAVWNSKYVYNVERPVQYIRRVMDPNWKTILNNPVKNVIGMTPEFPAYPSGHSGFGGAGAAILTDIFGSRSFTDKCHEGRTEFVGTPRTFNNFAELGVEDAYSRLPLGVHFRMDCDEGLRLGYLAALRVQELPWKK